MQAGGLMKETRQDPLAGQVLLETGRCRSQNPLKEGAPARGGEVVAGKQVT